MTGLISDRAPVGHAAAAQVLAAHRGMVDALAARDWPAMRAHMESHLDGLVRNLDAHFSDDDAEA